MSEDATSTKIKVAGLSDGAISKIKWLLEPAHLFQWTIFIALLYPANVNEMWKEKTLGNRTDLLYILHFQCVKKMLNKRE